MKYSIIYLFMCVLHIGSTCWLQRISETQICSTVEEVKEEAPKTWKKLQVLSSSHLKKDTFKNVPNLISLECRIIESIEEGTFNGLNKLEELSLFNVQMAQIPVGVLDNLSIKKLTISDSNLRIIQPGLFKNMPAIHMINLNNNSIVKIQRGVFDSSKLEILYLADNQIAHIAEKAFENMHNLTRIVLDNNLISSFNSELYLGTSNSLERLYLLKNKLTKVTKDMFTTIPNLIQLYLYLNKIETIELDSFKNLPKLEIVSFHINDIKEVQKGIFDNTNITELYLGNNRIEKVGDKAFENMSKLTHLSLRGNLLKSFKTELYLGLNNSLSSLYLSNNLFTKITSDMFIATPNLRELYLELNQIESIESKTFDKTPLLKFLDLSNNKLRSIKSQIFPYSGMKRLLFLVLHNNQLTYINQALFYRTPNLRYITYGGNPLQCPCHEQLTELLKNRNVSRICDHYYLTGQRPVCVFSSIAPQVCLYDEEVLDEVYVLYNKAIVNYPKLELKCDISNGIHNGFLRQAD